MRKVIEVDQSVKIEQREATIIAFSNDVSFAVVLRFKVKDEAIRHLRNQGETKPTAHVLVFAAGVFLVLKDYLDELHRVRIDTEYTGWENTIKKFLLQRIQRTRPDFEDWRITFAEVGKSSPAHRKAQLVRDKKDKGFRAVGIEELLEVLESK